jgi:hypothetical protein
MTLLRTTALTLNGFFQPTIFNFSIDANNRYLILFNAIPGGGIGVVNPTITLYIQSAGTALTLDASYQIENAKKYTISITGNGSISKIAINGTIIGQLSYVEPSGLLPSTILIGSQASCVYSAIGTAGRALTDDELRDLSAGRPVNGIQYYSLNGDLNGREITSGTHRGVVLANGASITSASQTYTAVDNGGASSNGIIANLHITASDQSTIAKIQHSVDNSTWVDLVTFASIAAGRGAERKIVTGTVNRYLRATWSGTLGTRTVVITAARM